jgi:pyridoxamine 5'-phosphate oxidase
MSQREDPLALFRRHLAAARRGSPEEVSDAMTVSTVDRRGAPRSRICLLRGLDARGFVFYTNLRSAKGSEIAANSMVALCFHWPALVTQVRVEGRARAVSAADADAYFRSRPRDSQLAAWASRQSAVIPSRKTLLDRYRAAEKKYEGGPVPRPPHWSGFRIIPDRIEFWYGRPSRLHERRLFRKGGGKWRSSILSP